MAFFKQEFIDGVTVVTAAWLNGIQEVVGAAAVAPEYSSEQTYSLGTLVSNDSKLYICSTPIATPEAWNASHWTATSLQELLMQQQGVFWCTYNTTSYADISGAVNGKKLPVCPYDFTLNSINYKGLAVYAYTGSGAYIFRDTFSDGSYVSIQVNYEDTWIQAVTHPVVPSGRTVNGKQLSSDITLTAEDIDYDESEDYSEGTIGNEITELKTSVVKITDVITTAQIDSLYS